MTDILTVLLSSVEIYIFGYHLSVPFCQEIVIDDHASISNISHKNIEHRQSVLVTHGVALVITLA